MFQQADERFRHDNSTKHGYKFGRRQHENVCVMRVTLTWMMGERVKDEHVDQVRTVNGDAACGPCFRPQSASIAEDNN